MKALFEERVKLCFRRDGIRCIANRELDEEMAYRTARAAAVFLKAKDFIVGEDMRISSKSLKNAFIRGLRDEGVDVTEVGRIGTPLLYFASGFYKKPGAMITASHNPKEYNGIKIVKKGSNPLGEENGLLKIKELVLKNNFKNKKQGKHIFKKDFKEYIKYVHSFINKRNLGKLNVIIDTGNGMGGKMIPLIYKSLPIKITKLDFKLDGNFPFHVPNPLKPENTREIRRKIKEGKFDLGMAFDADMDRIVFIDEKGKAIDTSFIASLIIKDTLMKKKSCIVHNLVMSKIVPDIIKKYKGKPLREKVGHAHIVGRMKKTNSLFGCEHSAHYYYKDNFYGDSGLITSLKVLEIFCKFKKQGGQFSDLFQEFRKYKKAEEISFKVKEPEKIMEKVRLFYKKKKQNPKIDYLDGMTITFRDFWFNLRTSKTEPLLRLNIEANNKNILRKNRKEIIKLIKSFD